MNHYSNDEQFIKVSFTSKELSKTDFDSCIFKNCDMSELHINGSEFLNCEFIDCNFSNSVVRESSFKEVEFINTKAVGVKFYEIDSFLFKINFNGCQLDLASFYQLKMNNFSFVNCSLKDVDFTEADLQHTKFDSCDFQGAVFDTTNLQHANFETAENFTIDMEKNLLKGAFFSKENVGNLLAKYKIHIS